jgi:hypothetical protein
MPKTKSYNLLFAYYPHASSYANGLEFKDPLFKGNLEKLKTIVESIVSKPSFLTRINYLSRNMGTTFAEDHFGGWDYNRSIHFNQKTTKIIVSTPSHTRQDKAAFLICIKGPIHFKKMPQGKPIDVKFWDKWPKIFNTHAHGNNVIGVFKAAQRNLNGTWPKKGVAGEVKCLGFQDRFKGGAGPDKIEKIINPVTGRSVLKSGLIGRRIVKVKGVFPNIKSYKQATSM